MLARHMFADDFGPAAIRGASREKVVQLDDASWEAPKTGPLNILFVGNSYTYGPAPYGSTSLNNLPRMFKVIAESLGNKVHQEEDTVGSCTLFMHRPSVNPEGCKDPKVCQKIDSPRVNGSLQCTIPAGIVVKPQYSPCPQRLERSKWDIIVLQDYSTLPSIQTARESMYYPAIDEYVKAFQTMGSEPNWKKPLIALYLTWPFLGGNPPGPSKDTNAACWPLGNQDALAANSSGWSEKVKTEGCLSYALALGVASGLERGADLLIPAGLAWEVARGSPEIDPSCKAKVNKEYGSKPPLSSLILPLRAKNSSYVQWSGEKGYDMFRYKGPNYTSPFCDGCNVDNHPSAKAMYLNALVFYAVIYKKCPMGAAWPNGQTVDGMELPVVSAEDAKTMQHLVCDVVMDNMDVWWKGH